MAMTKLTTTILAILINLVFAFGQTQQATTTAGRKVILYPDQTWKYATTEEPENDKAKAKNSLSDSIALAKLDKDLALLRESLKTKDTTSASSDCSFYIENKEDKMTGRKTIISKKRIGAFKPGGQKGFSILLMKSETGEISFSPTVVVSNSTPCMDKGTKINILFTDDTRLELINDADFNCKGRATVYFGGLFKKEKQLEELKTKQIKTVRVWTNDSFVEADFTPEGSSDFYQTINCLTK